jgi:hypothetical protein
MIGPSSVMMTILVPPQLGDVDDGTGKKFLAAKPFGQCHDRLSVGCANATRLAKAAEYRALARG